MSDSSSRYIFSLLCRSICKLCDFCIHTYFPTSIYL